MNAHKEILDNWDQIRIAHRVASLGTLSAAAKQLGVHHATIIRHIDALENRLGCKLFQRNPRGYNPTEAGIELLSTATKTEELFDQLASNLKGRSEAVSGDLVITSLGGLSPQITPLLVEFGRLHPEVRLTFFGDERPFQLQYGEAHVAVRAGPKPQELDNVAQGVGRIPVSLFAHQSYVEKYGRLLRAEDAVNHRFVGTLDTKGRAPFLSWVSKNVPAENIVFRASDMRIYEDAIHAGAGIGFLSLWSARSFPDVVQMIPPNPDWDTQLWLLTHVDLHRTAKVQALADFLKERLQSEVNELNAL